MSEAPEKRSLGAIYREQHREVTNSRSSRAFRIITPLILVAVAVGLIKISMVGSIVIAAVAVAGLIALGIYSARSQA